MFFTLLHIPLETSGGYPQPLPHVFPDNIITTHQSQVLTVNQGTLSMPLGIHQILPALFLQGAPGLL